MFWAMKRPRQRMYGILGSIACQIMMSCPFDTITPYHTSYLAMIGQNTKFELAFSRRDHCINSRCKQKHQKTTRIRMTIRDITGEAITLFSTPPCCQQHVDPNASASRHLCQNAVAWRNQAEKPRVHSVPLMQGCGPLDIPWMNLLLECLANEPGIALLATC